MEALDIPKSCSANRRHHSDRRTGSSAGYSGVEKRSGRDRRHVSDQRRYPRYKVKDVIFTRLISKNDEGLGEVIDISKSGISIRFFMKSDTVEAYSKMDMFLSSNHFLINAIPIKKVSDILLPNRTPFSVIVMRRFGFEFDELTDEQARQLDYYIENHTLGNA